MKTPTETIIVIVALNLLAAGFTSAGNVSGEGGRDEFEMQASGQKDPMLPSTSTQASMAAVNNNIYNLTKSLSLRSRPGSTGTVLVIPSGQTSTEDLLTINEDMGVMSRIFEKNIEQAQLRTAHSDFFFSRNDSFATFFSGGRGEIQSMYLQGYGALFLMKVDFPLTPPTDVQDDEKETQKAEEGDPVWQEMRRQMYEPDKVDRRHRTDRPEEKYDAGKVENLKTTLIKALKHATNIRSLKPDESVILTVTGSSEATGTIITSSRFPGGNQVLITERDADGKMTTRIVQGTSLDNIGSSSPAILIIRVKRSQIDNFAKGELDFDKFRERVQILTCPLLGGAVGSMDSHSQNIGRY